MNLFDKALIFTDIHHGKKNNDKTHNEDCKDFVDWLISVGKEKEVDTVIFCGDWHDNRHSLHVSTLNYSLNNLEKLSANFKTVYFIPGNHDLYYREKREIASVSFGRNLSNVTIINDFYTEGNVTFCPWLLGDEWKKIPSYAKKSDYMFGHFELPHFMMNAQIEMPDNGGLNASHFDEVTYLAFSGHFHKRQIKKKVCYLGNPFPFDFSDVWDDDRGLAYLEWGKSPEFMKWPKAPSFKSFNLSEFLEQPFSFLSENTTANIVPDVNLNFYELQFVKDVLETHYLPRKINFLSNGKEENEQLFETTTSFQSIDQMVEEGLGIVESKTIDKNILISLYRGLET